MKSIAPPATPALGVCPAESFCLYNLLLRGNLLLRATKWSADPSQIVRTLFCCLAAFVGTLVSAASAQTIAVNTAQVVTNTIAGQQVVATVSPIGVGVNTSVYYNNMGASYISPARRQYRRVDHSVSGRQLFRYLSLDEQHGDGGLCCFGC